MAETIDELTVAYSEGDDELVKELDKIVLSKGAWSTIIFKYQNWDKKAEAFGDDRYTIRRYQKRSGEYQLKSRFNISSKDQAKKIVETLSRWVEE